MAHPHRSQAKSSSTSKMRAITGKGGAGSAHMGMSPFKRANKHGEQQSFNSHSKGFESGYAHGGTVKARGDRRARGGKTVKSTESMRNENAGKLGMSTPGHFANGGRSKPKHKGDVNIVIMQPHKAPGAGAGMGMGAGAGQGLTGAPSPSPPPPGAGTSPMAGGQPNPQAAQALQAIAGGGGPGMGGLGALGAGLKAEGGRIGKKDGGVAGFTFKKGGQVWTATPKADGGSVGEMPNKEAHWAKYSSQNRKSKRGGTGESEELTLSTPEYKESDIKKADQRARGGRLGTTSKRKGAYPGAGQQSGEARLQQYRKGNF